jgi:hypothetical protein
MIEEEYSSTFKGVEVRSGFCLSLNGKKEYVIFIINGDSKVSFTYHEALDLMSALECVKGIVESGLVMDDTGLKFTRKSDFEIELEEFECKIFYREFSPVIEIRRDNETVVHPNVSELLEQINNSMDKKKSSKYSKK